MPYSSNSEIPEAMKKLPVGAQTMFRKAFNESYKRNQDDSSASRIAWALVKKRFNKAENGEWVAKSDAFRTTTFYKFQMTPAEEFISRTEDGNIIQHNVLTDVLPEEAGPAPTETLLKRWANWINENNPQVDTDHSLFEQVTRTHGGNIGAVKALMTAKQGIAKAIKAVVDKGRLIVSLLFDKRYERHMNRVKGLSIEAGVTRDLNTNKWVDGELFGFTLATNQRPVNPRAVRVA